MENVRESKNIELVTTDMIKGYLVSESNYHTTKWFSENLLSIEISKIEFKRKEPMHLGLLILDCSNITMYTYCYKCAKPKYGSKVKPC